MSQNSCQGNDDLCLEDLLEWYSGSISLIHYACGKGYLKAVKELIECKIDVNGFDENDYTPLHWAAQNGHSEIVRLLLANGSDINIMSGKHLNALHIAAISGQDEIVEFLLDNGININTLDDQNSSSLHIAAVIGNTSTANLLIMKGAEMELQNVNRWTPLLCATYYKNIEVARILLNQGANVNAVDINGSTPLLLIMKCWTLSNGEEKDNGCREFVQLLIDSGADLKIRDEKDRNVLHHAVFNGQDEIVELLIDNGFNCNILDNQSNSPLHLAASVGNTSTANILITKGAAIEVQGLNGWTPFLCATYYKKIEVARMFLNQGANINAVDKYGCTAMHYILRNISVPKGKGQRMEDLDKDFIRLLIDNRANLTIKDSTGKSVLEICKEIDIGEYVLDYLSKKKVSKTIKSKTFTLQDCIICNNPRQYIFALYPCGHANACESCCIKLLYSKSSNFRCYMCRTVISDYKKIYF